MTEAPAAYQSLEARFRRWNVLREAAGVLHWDMHAMMPAGGAEARGEQLAVLGVTCHEQLSDPAVSDLIEQAEGEGSRLSTWQAANLRAMRREWLHSTALDSDLVAALAKSAQGCQMIWRDARPAGDFAAVLPAFETLMALVRQAAQAKGEVLGLAPYDALLDEFQPGFTGSRIDAIFDPLADFLPPFIAAVLEKQARDPHPLKPEGLFPLDRQEALARRLMTAAGFDFQAGRLDVSLHPFCGGIPEDVRITTRYDQSDFMSALMGVLHETGHALYERGLPRDWRLQPVGEAGGMALHESQSLTIEMQVCRSADFLAFAAPLMAEAFGASGPAWQADNLASLAQRVERGFIRVDADEVTYPAHVILRARLERAMLADDLPLADLPEAWNAGLRDLLGVSPPDDRLGCLQDIHWYEGAVGYFPTYTLGAMIAAQLFAAAKAAVPEIPAALRRGDLGPLMDWLGAEVHAQGSLYSVDALLTRATGKPLDPAIFEAHLKARYLA